LYSESRRTIPEAATAAANVKSADGAATPSSTVCVKSRLVFASGLLYRSFTSISSLPNAWVLIPAGL
jgi:hypothetical protein